MPQYTYNLGVLLAKYKALGSLDAVAKELGLSRERVRQLFESDPAISNQYHLLFDAKVQRKQESYKKVCEWCSKSFVSRLARARYCSMICAAQQRAYHNPSAVQERAGFKVCSKCKQTKPVADFFPMYQKRRFVQKSPWCKKCHYLLVTEPWAKRHPEQAKEIQRRAIKAYQQRIQADPIKLARRREYQRLRYHKNKLKK